MEVLEVELLRDGREVDEEEEEEEEGEEEVRLRRFK